MYQPTLARFTSRDPLPPSGQPVLMNGTYKYANNSPLAFADPSGLAPKPFAPPPEGPGRGDDPGTFSIRLGDCDVETLNLHRGCCCTDVHVRYKPTAADKARYKKICVKVLARTRNTRNWPCSNTDNQWHVDVPKDKQSCWPPLADWTDYPGGAPSTGITCGGWCATPQIRQDYEGCAIGQTAAGAEEVIGCAWWGHICDVTFASRLADPNWRPAGPGGTPPLCCDANCAITRYPPNSTSIVPKPQKPGDWDPITDPPYGK